MAVKKTGSSAKKAAAADKTAKGAVRSTAKKTTVKKETAEVQAKAPSEQEFSVFVTDLDQYLFGHGVHYDIFRKLGAHEAVKDGQEGIYFAVWAPQAAAVHVIGSFNGWN